MNLRYLDDTQDHGIHYTLQNIRSLIQNVGLPPGYFSSKMHRDAGTDLGACVEANFINSVVDRH